MDLAHRKLFEGLNVQTVNDPLAMCVGAASQHVLRMSFVLEQEAPNFDRKGSLFGPVTLPRRCFFYLSSLVILEWDPLFNDMRLPHGVRGSRSILH